VLADIPYPIRGGQGIGAIVPLVGDEIERLSHSDYASAHWYDLAFQSGWIAASVPALVVVAHKRRNGSYRFGRDFESLGAISR
jgi:hypothetical protein